MKHSNNKDIKFNQISYSGYESAKKIFTKFSGFVDRDEFIIDSTKNKDVLDVGCIDHDMSVISVKSNWLHGLIKKSAKTITGLDFNKEQVQVAQKMGYNILYGNIENVKIDKKFDVIVCGEIIEHVYNVGDMLNTLRDHLGEDGIVIITTPNAFGLFQFFHTIIRGLPKIHPEHTALFDPQTLAYIIEQHNFQIKKLYFSKFYPGYADTGIKFFIKRYVVAPIYNLVIKFRPYLSEDIIYVISKNHEK